MNFSERKKFYQRIERDRSSKVLTFITSNRANMETKIAQDCIDPFVDLLEKVGATPKISLILHTNGGDTLAAWRLVNLLRMYCDELEVLIPSQALSAGTLIAIGADRLVMTKQAALGPIDPSIDHPLNPQTTIRGQTIKVPVSVEGVRGYLNAAREELQLKGEQALTSVLLNLTTHIHPLVLGEIFRSQAQIRFLANKLLPRQVSNQDQMKSVIDFLCADSGSHDYTINRREAAELGLKAEKPNEELYKLLRNIYLSYKEELELLKPYSPQAVLQTVEQNQPVDYSITRALVEGAVGGCYGFVSEGTLMKVAVPNAQGIQEAVSDNRAFEGWKKLHEDSNR